MGSFDKQDQALVCLQAQAQGSTLTFTEYGQLFAFKLSHQEFIDDHYRGDQYNNSRDDVFQYFKNLCSYAHGCNIYF
ncbi:hypothetical protein D3C80_2037400 [compost metagenome]